MTNVKRRHSTTAVQLTLLFGCSTCCQSTNTERHELGPSAVYDESYLIDVVAADSEIRLTSESVGILVPECEIIGGIKHGVCMEANVPEFRSNTAREMLAWNPLACKGTPLIDGSALFSDRAGSAIAVGPQHILTAAHALCESANSLKACNEILAANPKAVAFGWANDAHGKAPAAARMLRMVRRACQIRQPAAGISALDYVVASVDQDLGKVPQIVIDPRIQVTDGEQVTLLGHPIGLPMMASLGGRIMTLDEHTVMSNATALSGFSGGPLLDAGGRVVGIQGRAPTHYTHSLFRIPCLLGCCDPRPPWLDSFQLKPCSTFKYCGSGGCCSNDANSMAARVTDEMAEAVRSSVADKNCTTAP